MISVPESEVKQFYDELLSKEPERISELIIWYYNKALALFKLGKDEESLLELSKLNRLINSRLIDDSGSKEELYCNIAKLNFIFHNYFDSRKLFEKSIKQERGLTDSKDKAEFRFKKRLLLAFCYEYIAIDIKGDADRKELFNKAVLILVGINIDNEIERNDVINRLNGLSKYSDNKQLLEKIIELETDNDHSVSCLYKNIAQAYHESVISEKEYLDWIEQILHVLAHCLSERFEKNNSDDSNCIYYKRLAELIMKALGDKYITCYATIKMENNEYFSAISALLDARQRVSLSISDNNVSTKEKVLIAEIDFYCWYYSVCANYDFNGEKYKNAFRDYCDTSNDKVAKTYYHILNMKELLISGFKMLGHMKTDSDYITCINAEYSEFKDITPRYNIQTELYSACEFLRFSYSVYQQCFNLCSMFVANGMRRDLNNEQFQLALYNLSSLLFPVSKVEKYIERNTIVPNIHSLDLKKAFYIVSFDNGKFLYKGDKDTLIEACYKLKINIRNIIVKNYVIDDNTIETNKDVSNVLVISRKECVDEDIKFINAILQFDENKNRENCHNIFVDASCLDSDDSSFKSIEEDTSSIDYFNDTKAALMACALFASIESHIQLLFRKLDSHVVSPVSQDETYDYQYCDDIKFLEDKDIAGIKSGCIPNWGTRFLSCFSSEYTNKYKGSSLNIDTLSSIMGEDISHISYVFVVDINTNVKKKVKLTAYDFQDINLNTGKELYCDVVTITEDYDESNNDQYADIVYALKHLSNKAQYQKNHLSCEALNCYSVFTSKAISDSSFDPLRDYLYAYLGVLLDSSELMLTHTFNENRLVYYLCAYQKSEATKSDAFEQKVCGAIKLIDTKDLCNNEDVLSVKPIDYSRILSDLEHEIQTFHCSYDSLDPTKKYIFISYRGNKKTPRLCIPVYSDYIYLKKNYFEKFDCILDVCNFGENINKDIERYIKDERCIGAFMYLSEEYLKGNSTGVDYCVNELECLAEKKDPSKNNKFFVFPIIMGNKNNSEASLDDLLKTLFNKTVNHNATSVDVNIEKYIRKLLNIETGTNSQVYYTNCRPNSEHLLKSLNGTTGNNLRNSFADNGIVLSDD